MKNIITIISLVFLLASCSSDSPVHNFENIDSGTRKVTFSINGVSHIVSKNLRSGSLEDMNIKHIEYWVCNTADVQKEVITNPPLIL